MTSCSVEENILKKVNHKKIDFKEKSFKEALSIPIFNNAYQKVAKNKGEFKSEDAARTALEDQYGFTIVTDSPVRIITDENGTIFYTILIEREVKEELVFENLVIKVEGEETSAAVFKYLMDEKGTVSESGEYFSPNVETSEFTDLNVAGKVFYNSDSGETCITTTQVMCNATWSGEPYNHIANLGCYQYAANHGLSNLYESSSTVCFGFVGSGGGGTPDGSSNNTGGLGGSGGGTDSIDVTPIPCRTANCIELDEIDCNTSKDDLISVFPNLSDADAELLANVINEKGKDYGIDNKFKLQHFLSQAAHETGGFNNIVSTENMNYTTAERLLKIFPKYFSLTDINKENPTQYVGNPELIGNYVYCCKNGNGNQASGDGYKYRGRGLIQLTGKDNYQNFQNNYNSIYGTNIDLINNPELLGNDKNIAIVSALWYFKNRVIEKTNLKNGIDETVKKVTLKVNGGTNGLPDRTTKFESCQETIDCIE